MIVLIRSRCGCFLLFFFFEFTQETRTIVIASHTLALQLLYLLRAFFEFTQENSTIVIVTHGLALRLFLMRYFQWTVEQVFFLFLVFFLAFFFFWFFSLHSRVSAQSHMTYVHESHKEMSCFGRYFSRNTWYMYQVFLQKVSLHSRVSSHAHMSCDM